MTSWANLGTYLARLVKSIGATGYVLRDARGRHLSPRPPVIDKATRIKNAAALRRYLDPPDGDVDPVREMERRSVIQGVLAAMQRRIGNSPERAGYESPEELLRDERVMRHKERFDQHSTILEGAVGADFVTRGPGKRHVHRGADRPFIAERYLSSYLLIISFRTVEALDGDGVLLALERARSTLCDMLGDLPPDGGGDEALSNAKRL